jgi:hypothetical protein
MPSVGISDGEFLSQWFAGVQNESPKPEPRTRQQSDANPPAMEQPRAPEAPVSPMGAPEQLEGGFQVPLNPDPVVPLMEPPHSAPGFWVAPEFRMGSSRAMPPAPPCCREMMGGFIGGGSAHDMIYIFHPAPVQLVGGISSFGTFQHVPAPQPLHFLLSQPGQFVIGIGGQPHPVGPGHCCGGPVGGCCTTTLARAWAVPGAEPVPGCLPAVLPCAAADPLLRTPMSGSPLVGTPLIGTWYRDVGVGMLAVTFTPDEMKLCITPREGYLDGDKPFTITLTAHYALTRDGLVYGAVTGADMESSEGLDKEDSELLTSMQALADRPFSFRIKQTSAGMMVSSLKFSMFEGHEEKDMQLFGGLYKSAKDGKVPVAAPAPKKNNAGAEIGSAAGAAIGAVTHAPLLGAAVGGPSGAATGALIGCAEDKNEQRRRDAQAQRQLGVADVIALSRNGLSDTIIINQIQTTHSTFLLTVSDLAVLKDNGVSDLVIAEMQVARAAPPVPSTVSPAERIGVDFNTPQPRVMRQPFPPGTTSPPVIIDPAPTIVAPPAPPCPMPQPARPIGCGVPNDPMKLMAGEVFGQMLQSGPARPSGATPPGPGVLDYNPYYFNPEPAFPQPRELAGGYSVMPAGATPFAVAAPVKPGPIGTWYREIGGRQSVVKIAADHLSVTIIEAHEVDDNVITGSTIITADYQVLRDGATVVGVIVSVDTKLHGELSVEEMDRLTDELSELQKALENKPFAMNVRLLGDTLVIGSVRMPSAGEQMDFDPTPFIGGRYKSAGDKPLPKPKAIKAPPPPHGPAYNLPPGLYGPPSQPSYDLPPPAPVPLSPYNGPLPGRFPAAGVLPPVAPTALPPMPVPIEPAPSVNPPAMQMPQPATPPLSKSPKPVIATEMAVAWRPKIEYQPDPTRNGAMGAGLAGQLFLFGGPKLEFAQADGVLTVDLIDETPRAAGQPAATPERWQFNKEMLRNLRTTDDTFGKSYVLFLPWPAYKADITKVKISARYDPDNGYTLFCAPEVVTLSATAPVWDSTGTTNTSASPKAECGPPMTKPAVPVQQMPQPVHPIGCGGPNDASKQLAKAYKQLVVELEADAPAPAPVKPGIVGTWYREIGPMMCILKIEADHLTITAYATGLLDDKEAKEGAVITADYHLMRNGTTVVGLVTGFDWLIEGDVSELGELLETLSGEGAGKIQKVVDLPFAFNVRVYGDVLMVGNVKAPALGDESKEAATVFAGRYKSAGDKPVPKPKPINKGNVELPKPSSSSLSLPSPRYLEHFPQYFPPDAVPPPMPPASTTQSIPSVAPTAAPADVPAMVPPASEPESAAPMGEPMCPGEIVPVVPQMPQPAPPVVGESGSSRRPFRYSSDPNIRMQQLLDESEDLRQMNNEWRRFWFNDQPNALVPPPMCEPAPPVPPMPQPTPPAQQDSDPSSPSGDAPPVESTSPVPPMSSLSQIPTLDSALPVLLSAPPEPVDPSKEPPTTKLCNEVTTRAQWLLDHSEVLKRVREEAAPKRFEKRQLFNFDGVGPFGGQ